MAVFICKNPSCDQRGTIKSFDKVTYIMREDALYCPQKTCTVCSEIMEDATEFDGFPSNGVPRGSSNPLIGRKM